MKRAAALLLFLAILISGGVAMADTPEEVIEEAMEVYAWMTMWPLDVNVDIPGGDGKFLVLDERYQTREALDAKLSDYFSAEIVDELWSWNTYDIVDGMLYAEEDAGRSIDENISEIAYEITSQTDERIVYTVTVNYLSEGDEVSTGTYIFVREFAVDHWVFTAFPFFW